MKKETSTNHMKPRKAFQSHDEQEMILIPLSGQGLMREYRIEPGLVARSWDCTFSNHTELDEELQVYGADCVLAFFPDDVGLQLCQDKQSWDKNGAWNVLFARRCQIRIFLSATTRYRCVSIHFSLSWLRKNKTKAVALLRQLDRTGKGIVLLDSVNRHEMEPVCELLESSWKKTMGNLFIKSLVFQQVSDFFERIRNDEAIRSISCNGDDIVAGIEQIVLDHVDAALPKLKELASRFCISESSLKRRFLEKHGETINTYFWKKKMAYAKFLMEQRGYSMTEASRMVGYKTVSHFVSKYRRFCTNGAVNRTGKELLRSQEQENLVSGQQLKKSGSLKTTGKVF